MIAHEVHAAGGVIVRDGLVAVVHRPHRQDWSLPKGHVDPGETFRDAARREVVEETGYRCALGEELTEVRYQDHLGQIKRVRYWLMTVTDGDFVPNAEVDELRWLPPDDAIALLTYGNDQHLVREAVGRLVTA